MVVVVFANIGLEDLRGKMIYNGENIIHIGEYVLKTN